MWVVSAWVFKCSVQCLTSWGGWGGSRDKTAGNSLKCFQLIWHWIVEALTEQCCSKTWCYLSYCKQTSSSWLKIPLGYTVFWYFHLSLLNLKLYIELIALKKGKIHVFFLHLSAICPWTALAWPGSYSIASIISSSSDFHNASFTKRI